MQIDYPFHFDDRGCTAQAKEEKHIRDLIEVQAVEVASEDSTITVTVQYLIKHNQQRQVEQFSREV